MSVVRRHHNSNYTVVPNAIFEDARLSIEAKGVLGYLLSRPHNWTVRLGHVAKTLEVGRDKMQRIFNELIEARYMFRDQRRGENQHWGEIEYVVFDEPIAPETRKPQPAFPCAAFPCAENTVAYQVLSLPSTDSIAAADARAREPACLISPEAFALRDELLRLMRLDPEDPQSIGMAYQVQSWLSKGWKPDVIRSAIDVVMARRSKAPRSLRYFEEAIAEAHAERDRPLPTATNVSRLPTGMNRNAKPTISEAARSLAERVRAEHEARFGSGESSAAPRLLSAVRGE
jgi:hypothetical protein